MIRAYCQVYVLNEVCCLRAILLQRKQHTWQHIIGHSGLNNVFYSIPILFSHSKQLGD